MEFINIGSTQVRVERKKVKNLNLRIKKDGQAVISVPIRAKDSLILSFLQSKSDWILAKQTQVKQAAILNNPPKGTVNFWGKQVPLMVVNGNKNALEATHTNIILTLKDLQKQQEVFKHLLKQALYTEIKNRLPMWEQITALKASAFIVRDMTSRWGSCNINTKKLTFALRLIEKPPICLDYVIVHELLHLKVPNHGEKFKLEMDKYFPDWRNVRKMLR